MENQALNIISGYPALKFHIALARKKNKIISISSLPGVGKSAMMAGVAEWGDSVLPPDVSADELPVGWKPEVFTTYVPQVEDIDAFMPAEVGGEYVMLPAPMLTRLTLGCYQVFDEWTVQGCQKLMLQMCSGDRLTAGNFVGPRGITRVLIGNTVDSGNFDFVDNSVLGNRLRQYEWTPKFQEWLTDFALPYGIHPLIATSVKMEGQKFFLDYDMNRTRNCTPRSLTDASDTLIAAEEYTNGNLSDAMRMEILAGSLHDEAALKIQSLFHLADKLTPYTAIVANPDIVEIPSNAAALFMTCTNVSRRCSGEDWSPVMDWVNRLPLELRGSVVEPIVTNHQALKSTHEYQRYLSDTNPLRVAP